MTFLDEIEREFHNDLLESGNLRKRHSIKAPFAPWVEDGYSVRTYDTQCACGRFWRVLGGVFTRFVRGSDLREQAVILDNFQFPPGSKITYQVDSFFVAVCADCFPQRLFGE